MQRLVELKRQHDKLLACKTELELLTSKRKIELADTKIIREYVEDLHRFLDGSELTERKAFLKGFIKEITITGHEGRMRYVLPPPPDDVEEEKLTVLPIVQYSGRWCTIPRTFELSFSLK